MCSLWRGITHWSGTDRPSGGPRLASSSIGMRMDQARILSAIGRCFGVSVRDWTFSAWIVEDRTGRSAIVESLPEVWGTMSEFAGREIDPLDPHLITRMESGGAVGP